MEIREKSKNVEAHVAGRLFCHTTIRLTVFRVLEEFYEFTLFSNRWQDRLTGYDGQVLGSV